MRAPTACTTPRPRLVLLGLERDTSPTSGTASRLAPSLIGRTHFGGAFLLLPAALAPRSPALAPALSANARRRPAPHPDTPARCADWCCSPVSREQAIRAISSMRGRASPPRSYTPRETLTAYARMERLSAKESRAIHRVVGSRRALPGACPCRLNQRANAAEYTEMRPGNQLLFDPSNGTSDLKPTPIYDILRMAWVT